MNEDWREGLTDEELFEKWDGLINYTLARRFSWLYSWEDVYQDMQQEGYLALWRAIKSYNPESGTPLNVYAYIAIYRAMNEYYKYRHKKMDSNNFPDVVSYNYNENEGKDGKGFEVGLFAKEVVAEEHLYLDDFINSLTPRQKVIYEMTYKGCRREEIEKMTFVSHTVIAEEKKKIKEKFKQHVMSF